MHGRIRSDVFDEEELLPEATIGKFRIVQTEGSRHVGRLIDHYNLEMIIGSSGKKVLASTTLRLLARKECTNEKTAGISR